MLLKLLENECFTDTLIDRSMNNSLIQIQNKGKPLLSFQSFSRGCFNATCFLQSTTMEINQLYLVYIKTNFLADVESSVFVGHVDGDASIFRDFSCSGYGQILATHTAQSTEIHWMRTGFVDCGNWFAMVPVKHVNQSTMAVEIGLTACLK